MVFETYESSFNEIRKVENEKKMPGKIDVFLSAGGSCKKHHFFCEHLFSFLALLISIGLWVVIFFVAILFAKLDQKFISKSFKMPLCFTFNFFTRLHHKKG